MAQKLIQTIQSDVRPSKYELTYCPLSNAILDKLDLLFRLEGLHDSEICYIVILTCCMYLIQRHKIVHILFLYNAHLRVLEFLQTFFAVRIKQLVRTEIEEL